MLTLDMAGNDCRAPGAEVYEENDGGISPDQDQMMSFLDLETSTTSSFPLDDADCGYPESSETSFFLQSPGTSVEALMEDNPKAAAAHDSESSWGRCASPSSGPHPVATTVTTCTSSRDSLPRSSQRHSLLDPARRHFQKLRFKDEYPHQDDDAEDSDRSQRRRPRSLLLLDTYFLDHSTTPTDDDLRRDESQNRASLDDYGSMTKAEFDALPPTIQRKYFSTLERLRIIGRSHNSSGLDGRFHPVERVATHQTPSTKEVQPALRLGFGSNELENAPHRRAEVKANPLRRYRGPQAGLRTRRRSSSDELASLGRQHRVILDAADESLARIGKRQSKLLSLDDFNLGSSTVQAKKGKMVSFTTEAMATNTGLDPKTTPDSLFESLRWLDEGEDLDLKLALDDYNIRPKEAASPRSWRSGSMRRHLSISKLPFINTTPLTQSRPGTKDTMSSPPLMGSPASSAPGSPGHVRRRSRALSLITPTKPGLPDPAAFTDPGAAHYQDPDARMKLRVYLGSPHKFDEAVEFGFPSIDKVQQGGEVKLRERSASQHEKRSKGFARLSTFAEDEGSSQYTSDEASTEEPESPRTPEATEKSMSLGVAGDDQEAAALKTGYAQAPAASREMTLRMTLTRPDLRANEEQIYGWQKGNGRRQPQEPAEAPQKPSSPFREGFSKESIERQLAAMDQEELANESGGFKRFWNRMRRS